MNNALYIAWRTRDADGGAWGPVGRLEFDGSAYRFLYTGGAKSLPGFQPFAEMPNLEEVYESQLLFPLFENRLLARSRPEYEAFLVWGGFDPNDPPDPIAVLGVTEGLRQTDSLEVFPAPMPDVNGCYVNKFFLHGVRWFGAAALERIGRLCPGEVLGVMPDISNPFDRNAVAVRTCDLRDRLMIGYVPRYLARDVGQLCHTCKPDFIKLTVERVNADAPLQQRLLCRMSACWPRSFAPCTAVEFQPIVNVPALVPA